MKTDIIEINPHQAKMQGELTHTDTALTGLYNATVSIVNSERTVVWQRYNSLLVANSIFSGFVVRDGPSQGPVYVVIGCIVGLLLCFFWWTLTRDGWRFFDIYSKMAQRFRWPEIDDEANANLIMFKEFKRIKEENKLTLIGKFNGGDTIKTSALGVISLFGFSYFLFGFKYFVLLI